MRDLIDSKPIRFVVLGAVGIAAPACDAQLHSDGTVGSGSTDTQDPDVAMPLDAGRESEDAGSGYPSPDASDTGISQPTFPVRACGRGGVRAEIIASRLAASELVGENYIHMQWDFAVGESDIYYWMATGPDRNYLLVAKKDGSNPWVLTGGATFRGLTLFDERLFWSDWPNDSYRGLRSIILGNNVPGPFAHGFEDIGGPSPLGFRVDGILVDESNVYVASHEHDRHRIEEVSRATGVYQTVATWTGVDYHLVWSRESDDLGYWQGGWAQDGGHLYYSEDPDGLEAQDGRIMRFTKGSAEAPSVLFDSQSSPRAVVLRDGYLYWATGGTLSDSGAHNHDSTVVRAQLGTQAIETLASDLVKPSSLAVDDEHVYWAHADEPGSSETQIWRNPIDGTGEPELISTDGGIKLTLSATHLYWIAKCSGNRLVRVATR